ncbi:hypothetical protein [Methylobacterium durans]|uniref:hypothetical protein n=1 Tax=Methylobacterium durans TaxID=2202825 RepID=UPI0013A53440|nr:hypothetical protein [Methylobacterium durans]
MRTRYSGTATPSSTGADGAPPRLGEPSPDVLRRAAQGIIPSSRGLASVAIDHAVIGISVADLGLDAVHLTLGRDETSGLIVVAALDAERRGPRDVLRLFGNVPGTAARSAGLGAVWTCPGMPEAVVVDNGTGYHDAAFQKAAEELGIQVLHRPPRALPGRSHLEALLGGHGACRYIRGHGVVTMAMLVGAVHAWVAACYQHPRGRDTDASCGLGSLGSEPVPPRQPARSMGFRARARILQGQAAWETTARALGRRRR